MWKPIETPGEWLVFLQREDIKGLPIMEARKRYMQEQLLFEGYINNVNTVNTINSTTSAPASAAAGGGGLRKFKYPALFELVVQKGSDSPGLSGDYERVAVSQLKQYWYDNFYVEGQKGGGYFTIPPPPSPDVNLGSNFVFIDSSGNIVAWGRPQTRGRQRGEWTLWQFVTSGKQPIGSTPSGNWEVFTTGPTDLKTPSGTYLYQKKDPKSGKTIVYYTFREKKLSPPPKGALVVTGAASADVTYLGNYVKDPNSGEGQNAVYIREDQVYKIWYSSTCGMWRLELNANVTKLNCTIWTGNPSGDDPKGTYQISAVRAPQTGTYTVS